MYILYHMSKLHHHMVLYIYPGVMLSVYMSLMQNNYEPNAVWRTDERDLGIAVLQVAVPHVGTSCCCTICAKVMSMFSSRRQRCFVCVGVFYLNVSIVYIFRMFAVSLVVYFALIISNVSSRTKE